MRTKRSKTTAAVSGQWGLPSALMLACLAVAGCGGSSTPSNTPTSSLSGSVIDGYIEGAEVCLDLNNNQVCDTGEPKTTTSKDGSYKLDTTSLTVDQIKAAHLLTTVPATAKDADDAGKTLAEAGKSAFNLLAPAAAYVKADGSVVTGAVISPLTTLVSHEMITGNTPLATAKSYVTTRLALADGTDLTQDFVAKKDATLTEKAQVLTAAIGEVKAQALKDTTTAPSDKQALFAALQYLQTQVAELQKAVDAAKANNSSAKPVDLVKTAITTEAAKPVVSDLVGEAKKTTDSSTSAIASLLQAGFYGADHILENCGSGTNTICTPSYWKVSGSNGTFTSDQDYQLSGSAWVESSSQNNSLRLTDKGWVSGRCTGGSYSEDSTGGGVTINCNGWTQRVSAREVDASGKTLKALGLKVPSNYADTTPMPTGAKLYWFTFAGANDLYNIYTGSKVQQWSSSANAQVSFTSLNDFIAFNGAGTQGMGWSGLRFTFDAGGTSTGGTVTLLDYSNWPSRTAIGKANYEIRTVYGKQVLVILKPAPQNGDGSYVMFAVNDGYVYGGDYRSAAVANQSEPNFNKTMMNAILKAGSKPAVLD